MEDSQVVKSSSGSAAISVVVTTIPTATSQTACVDPTNSEAARRRLSKIKLVGVSGLERQNYCCGHWFPSSKSYHLHLAEKAVTDTTHEAKLLDLGMVRCAQCSVWVHTENIIAHLAKGHTNNQEAKTQKMVPMGTLTEVPRVTGDSMLSGTNIVIKVTGQTTPKSFSSSLSKTSGNPLSKSGTVKLVTSSNSTLFQKVQNMKHSDANGTDKMVVRKSVASTVPMVNVGPRLVMKSLGAAGVGHLSRGHKVVQKVAQPGLSSVTGVNGVTLTTTFKAAKQSPSGVQGVASKTPLKAVAPQSNLQNIAGRSLKLVKRITNETSKSKSVKYLTSNSQNKLGLPQSTKTKEKKVLKVLSGGDTSSSKNVAKKRRKQVLKPSTGDLAYTDTNTAALPPPPPPPVPGTKTKKRVRVRKSKLSIPDEGGNSKPLPNHKGQRKKLKETFDYDTSTPKVAKRPRKRIRGGLKKNKKRRPGRPRKNQLSDTPDSSELDSLFDEIDREDLENEPVVKTAAAVAAKKEEENIPTVELDLFTLPSTNEQVSVLLTEPQNPNFKVYASMDAIFVGDSALGDVTNQIGYVTDANNVVYVNPSHFLFPNVEDLENFVPSPILTMKGNKVGLMPVRKTWSLGGNKTGTPIVLKQVGVKASRDTKSSDANLEKKHEAKESPVPHAATKSKVEEQVLKVKTTPSTNKVLVKQEKKGNKKVLKLPVTSTPKIEIPEVAKEPQIVTTEMPAPKPRRRRRSSHKRRKRRRKSGNEKESEKSTSGLDGSSLATESKLKPVCVPSKGITLSEAQHLVNLKNKERLAANESLIQKCVVKLEELKYPINFEKSTTVSSAGLLSNVEKVKSSQDTSTSKSNVEKMESSEDTSTSEFIDTLLTNSSVEESLLTSATAEDSVFTDATAAEESLLTNTEAEESVLTNTEAEESVLTNTAEEESLLTDTAEESQLTNTEAEESQLTNIEAEESQLTNTEAEESVLTNTEAEESQLTNTEAEESVLTNTEAEESQLTNTEAEESQLTNTEAEESQLTNTAEEESLLTDTAEESLLINTAEESMLTSMTAEESLSTSTAAEESVLTNVTAEESRLTSSAAEESMLTSMPAEDSLLSSTAAEESVLNSMTAEESQLIITTAEESVLTNDTAEESQLTNNLAEESMLTSMTAEDSILTSTAAQESRLTDTAVEESMLTNTEAEESQLTNTEAEKSQLTNTEAEESVLTNTEAEKSVLTNTEAEKSVLTNTEAEESQLTNTAVEESQLINTEAEESQLINTAAEESQLTSTAAEESELSSSAAEESPLSSTAAEESVATNASTEESHLQEELPINSSVCVSSDTEGVCEGEGVAQQNSTPNVVQENTLEQYASVEETLFGVGEDTTPEPVVPQTCDLSPPASDVSKVLSRTLWGGLPRRMRRRRLRTKSANIVSSKTETLREFGGVGIGGGGGIHDWSDVCGDRRVRHVSENSVLPDKAEMSEQERVPVNNQSDKSESGHSPKRKLEKASVARVDVENPINIRVSELEQFTYPHTDVSLSFSHENTVSDSNNTLTISPSGERKRAKKHKTKHEGKETPKVDPLSVEPWRLLDQSDSVCGEQSTESDREEKHLVRLVRERRPSFKLLESISVGGQSPKRSQVKSEESLHSPTEHIPDSQGSRQPGEDTVTSPSSSVPDSSPSREWLGRGAKLKAQVLIQDQQAGVMDSHIFPPNDSLQQGKGSGECTTPRLIVLSPSRISSLMPPSKTPSPTSSKPTKPLVAMQNREWQARGAKLKAQVMISDPESSLLPYTNTEELPKPITSPPSKKMKLDLSLSPANTKDIRSFFKSGKSVGTEEGASLLSPGSPASPISPHASKTPKRQAKNGGDIRRYFSVASPTTSAKKIKEENVRSSPKKLKSHTSTSSGNTIVRSSYEDVKSLGKSLPVSEDAFEGFRRLTRQSSLRSKALLRLVSFLNTKKWNRLNKFPLPVDQLCDWDDELLSEYDFD